MLVIGLTGGICSGKTTVANLFSQLGVHVIDSDVIAREVVKPLTIGYEKIVEHFGQNILLDDQTIDRKKLGNIIFSDAKEKSWLEKLLHPLILTEIKSRIDLSKKPYCIVVIPLLVETKSFGLVDRILLIDASEEDQILRAKQRDSLDTEQVMKIIKSQASRKERIAHADDIICNNGDIDQLKKQVERLHKQYLLLSQETE